MTFPATTLLDPVRTALRSGRTTIRPPDRPLPT
ncbi:Uncharacterised protein [Mycobacteroides abscessus]|nr:Uncharacterised protein [Mycobacteroides abscessus]